MTATPPSVRKANFMRIMYLINSMEGGGAALPVPRIARALARHGAELRVFALTRRDGRAIEAFERAGVPITVRDGGRKDHAAAYRWIGNMLQKERPDILWTSLTRATVLGQRAAMKAGVPVISWQHAAHLKPGSAFILKRQQRMTSLWVADSDRVTEITARRLGVERARLLTWPIFAADPQAPVAKAWDGRETLRIGSLGRLHHIKGYDVLADAIAILRQRRFRAPVDWEVSIAGDGPERARLLQSFQGVAGERMSLAGYVSRPTDYVSRLHAYVQPSRSEGFCIAAHEAMQAGLPVLASAVGGMVHSIEQDVSGWLVPPDNPAALADGLVAMLSDPGRLAGMGRTARDFVFQHYGDEQFDATAGVILDTLAEIVRARRPASGARIARAA